MTHVPEQGFKHWQSGWAQRSAQRSQHTHRCTCASAHQRGVGQPGQGGERGWEGRECGLCVSATVVESAVTVIGHSVPVAADSLQPLR